MTIGISSKDGEICKLLTTVSEQNFSNYLRQKFCIFKYRDNYFSENVVGSLPVDYASPLIAKSMNMPASQTSNIVLLLTDQVQKLVHILWIMLIIFYTSFMSGDLSYTITCWVIKLIMSKQVSLTFHIAFFFIAIQTLFENSCFQYIEFVIGLHEKNHDV